MNLQTPSLGRPASGHGLAAFATAALLLSALPSQAHVTLERPEAPAGSYYKAVLSVSHGCQGSPTLRVRVQIPEGVAIARPQPKPGWTLEIKRTEQAPGAADQAQASHHHQQHHHHHQHATPPTPTPRVSEVVWSGGPLPDDQFDEFRLVIKLPDRPGTMLHLPVTQECQQGVLRWTQVPAAGQSAKDLKEPAPGVRLMPKP